MFLPKNQTEEQELKIFINNTNLKFEIDIL